MPIVLGLDLGTTTITALALDTDTGEVVGRSTVPNPVDTKHLEYRARGWSERDAPAIARDALDCLERLARQLSSARDVAGLALTGQQHGVVLVELRSMTTQSGFIDWQDRRGDASFSPRQTFTARAQKLIGTEAAGRTGCRLASGYMAVTLFWFKRNKLSLRGSKACFLADYFATTLTDSQPVTDPTLAASSGVFDVARGAWADDLIRSLGLAPNLFPEVRPPGSLLGHLTDRAALHAGLPPGPPLFVGLGDNQASFLGSVASPEDSVLVNVGTGGQVSVLLDEFHYEPGLETRPFPGGFLLVCAGLTGGRVYAVLESFFRQVGRDVFGQSGEQSVYETMNRLAASVPPGCDGLRCEPFFSGTRQQPELRGSWSGVSATNFTPAHMTRALLEGMARSFKEGFDRMTPYLSRPRKQLVAAGNGMRENPLLRQIVGEAFGLPVLVPRHREEAAYGAALTAAVGAGIFPDFRSAARLIRYELASRPGGA
jgi:sugar (pentulose or hexulose) kinase